MKSKGYAYAIIIYFYRIFLYKSGPGSKKVPERENIRESIMCKYNSTSILHNKIFSDSNPQKHT